MCRSTGAVRWPKRAYYNPYAAAGDDSLLTRMEPLARRLCSWVQSDGIVLSEGALRSRTDVDFLPGVALLALAESGRRTGSDLAIDWGRVRDWHRRRFELLHPWGTALWHAWSGQSCSKLSGEDTDAGFAFEIADWMTAQQLCARTGPSSPTSTRRVIAFILLAQHGG